MASYPNSLPTLTNPSPSNQMDDAGVELDVVIGAVNDEVEAIGTELGTNPKTITDATAASASPTSVAQYLDMVATQLKAIIGGANWYTTVATSLASIVSTVTSLSSTVTTHTSDTANPHSTSDANLAITDVTTNNSSTSKHGFLKKLDNDITHFMRGDGSWAAPAAASNDGWISDSNTWTYSSADGATGVFTVNADVTANIQIGDRIKLTQTTAKYFIVTKAPSYSAPNTTITVWGGTDYTLANAAISSPYYSHIKNPFGFSTDPSKWTIETKDTSDRTQGSPAGATWYNMGSLSADIHIGLWYVEYFVNIKATGGSSNGLYTTLSTANNSNSDADFEALIASSGDMYGVATKRKLLTLTSKTTYYLNGQIAYGSETTIGFMGSSNGSTYIRAVCALL